MFPVVFTVHMDGVWLDFWKQLPDVGRNECYRSLGNALTEEDFGWDSNNWIVDGVSGNNIQLLSCSGQKVKQHLKEHNEQATNQQRNWQRKTRSIINRKPTPSWPIKQNSEQTILKESYQSKLKRNTINPSSSYNQRQAVWKWSHFWKRTNDRTNEP